MGAKGRHGTADKLVCSVQIQKKRIAEKIIISGPGKECACTKWGINLVLVLRLAWFVFLLTCPIEPGCDSETVLCFIEYTL